MKKIISTLLLLLFFTLILYRNYQKNQKLSPFSESKNILCIAATRSFIQACTQREKKRIWEDFEKKYDCQIQYFVMHRNRFLTSSQEKCDVILGMNYEGLSRERVEQVFMEHDLDGKQLTLPEEWNNRLLIPFQYTVLSFIYDARTLKTPPTSFEELLQLKKKILLIDPRTSHSGFGLLLWIRRLYGEKSAEYWKRLRPHILTITSNWSMAYSLFRQGESPIMCSYSTSPLYYQIREKNSHIQMAHFSEGHYIQYDVAGISRSTKNYRLAQNFLSHLLTEELQREIALSNWVYPVVDVPDLPEAFSDSIPYTLSSLPLDEVFREKNFWLKEWLNASS